MSGGPRGDAATAGAELGSTTLEFTPRALRAGEYHFAVGTEIEEPARGVVGARAQGVTRRMELDRVDVGLVPFKILDVVAGSHVPHEGHLVARLKTKFLVTKITINGEV